MAAPRVATGPRVVKGSPGTGQSGSYAVKNLLVAFRTTARGSEVAERLVASVVLGIRRQTAVLGDIEVLARLLVLELQRLLAVSY